MTDLPLDIAKIIQSLDDLDDHVAEVNLRDATRRLIWAAREVGQSWSKSWFGYHACVYYRGFRAPGRNAYFDNRWGINRNASYLSNTAGDWAEYDRATVTDEILKQADNPDLESLQRFNRKASWRFRDERENLLSIIDIEISRSHSKYLIQMRNDLSRLVIVTAADFRSKLVPKEWQTEDLRAIQQGLVTPPHIETLCAARSLHSTVTALDSLKQIAKDLKLHIERRRALAPTLPSGSRVFIGHGHSMLWRTLKDFLEDRLGLEVDEFSRVPTAGVPTTERLRGMLDGAGFAFLMMTGEDELADGNLRARENVVHEVGLFQGKLGFEKAIILLEDGCEEFSNIAGLGQIRFSKGNIEGKFEEIRRVLEREGLLDA